MQSNDRKTILSTGKLELFVSRREFAHALRTASLSIKDGARDACLSFSDGCLLVEAGDTSVGVPASGQWPETIFVDAHWVRRLAKRLPAGDPLRIHVDGERLYINRYSEPCRAESRPRTEEIDEQALILKAAQILKPLRLTLADLELAADAARARGAAIWRVEDSKMMSLIAKAWVLLAPLGIETADLRRMADKAVRDAWKTKP